METVATDDGIEVQSSHETRAEMQLALTGEVTDETPTEDKPVAAEPPAETEPAEPKKEAAQVEAPKPAVKEKKPRNDATARMLDATAKEAAAKREAAEARAEAQRLRDELAAARRAPAQQEPPRQAQPPAPVAKFPPYQEYLNTHPQATPEDWMDARDNWRDEQRATAARVQQIQTASQARMGRFHERMTPAMAAKDPDSQQRVNYLLGQLRPITSLQPNERATGATSIADVVLDSENPDALVSHFVEHPDDFQRISTLHPISAFRELGKLEARLDAASATGSAPTPVYSKATPPPKPVSGSPVVSDDDVDEADLPVEEFIRRGNKRDRTATRR